MWLWRPKAHGNAGYKVSGTQKLNVSGRRKPGDTGNKNKTKTFRAASTTNRCERKKKM